jgi:hypothetical protein
LHRILNDKNKKLIIFFFNAFNLSIFILKHSTLKFANRAKNIKNIAVINEDLDQKTLLRKYEIELNKLKKELMEKNKELFDKTHLLQDIFFFLFKEIK